MRWNSGREGLEDDFDGDGICNVVDIDDDNDGVLDTSETTCSSGIVRYDTQSVTTNGSIQDNEISTLINTSPSDITIGAGIGINSSLNAWQFNSPVPAYSDLASAIASDAALYMPFTTSSSVGILSLEEIGWIRLSSNYTGKFGVTIEEQGSSTYTILYDGDVTDFTPYTVNLAGSVNVIDSYAVKPSTTYIVKLYPYNMTGGRWWDQLRLTFVYCDDFDTDSDGTSNRFDLDSDGDGCFDATESNVGVTVDGNGKVATTSTEVGSNGLADIVETSAESGVINYDSTYDFAIEQYINLCTDSDSDGIVDIYDIDDDNDGVLDAVESPSCFYSEEGAKNIVSITSEANITASEQTQVAQMLGDGGTPQYGLNFPNGEDVSNKAILSLELTGYIELSSIDIYTVDTSSFLNSNNTSTPGSGTYTTVKIQGSYNGETWVDLSTPVFYDRVVTGNVESFVITQNAGNYKYYQLVGDASTSTTYIGGTITQIQLNSTNYSPSSNPIPQASCSYDTDSDNTPNHLDLDSDGDGCFDATESNVGVTVDGNGKVATTGTEVGINGLDNDLEASDTYGTSVNYSSTYIPLALDDTLDACPDTDGDEIGDLIDIDDDNDGVLDTVESPNCFYTEDELKTIVKVTSSVTYPSTEQDELDALATSTSAGFNFTNNASATDLAIFTIELTGFVELSNIDFVTNNTFSFLNPSNTTIPMVTASGGSYTTVFLEGSYDNTNWVQLSSEIFYDRTATGSVESFPVTQNAAAYKYYRIVGDSSKAKVYSSGTVNAINLTVADFIAVPKSTCTSDDDGDSIYNHLDLDSDGDDCPDASESAVSTATGSPSFISGDVVNGDGVTNTTTSIAGAVVDSPYGSNGFADSLETSGDGVFTGVYTYSDALDSSIFTACGLCSSLPLTTGTAEITKTGISTLDIKPTNGWPQDINNGFLVLESNEKGFVITRIADPSNDIANPIEGMLVFDTTDKCLKMYIGASSGGWSACLQKTCL